MSENRPQISRRRLIAGTGAGAAAIWAAPAITSLGTAAGATGSSCSVFRFYAPALSSPPLTPSTALTGTFTAFDSLTVTQGNVDIVGPGTDYSAGYTSVVTIDLTGTNGALGSVTNTTLVGPNLPAKPYRVEVEYFGALDGENNTLTVNIGATTMLGPVAGATPLGAYSADSGVPVAASGVLTLLHNSPSANNQGLFLKRLEVFIC